MPTCHLHIGLHKTASTTVQTMLLANHARLAAQGIYVPRTRTDDYARVHHQLAWEFGGRGTRDVLPGGFEELKEELAERMMPEDILLSSEDFEWSVVRLRSLRRLSRLFAEMGYRLRLIAYIRPQIGTINSAFTQLTKALSNTVDCDAFVANAIKLPRYDYASRLLPVLDMKRIEVAFRPFNHETIRIGIAQDFLSVLGLDEAAIAEMDIPNPKNIRPGPWTIEACLELARRMSGSGIVLNLEMRNLASRAILRMSDRLNWNDTGFSGIGAAEAETMRKRYAHGNDIFARRVWGLSWEDVYGSDCWIASPRNAFDRDKASKRDAREFDGFVDNVWLRLKDGDVKGLAIDADLPQMTVDGRGWLDTVKAFLVR